VLARVGVAVLAVAAIGWLGVMERDVRLQSSAVDAADAREFARAERDLRRARLLHPDTLPDVRRAFLYQGSGRSREALALLEDVVRREPENLAAWRLLRSFAGDDDPALAGRAVTVMRRLDPVNAPPP
jgi:predicted Zn-dependent protease